MLAASATTHARLCDRCIYDAEGRWLQGYVVWDYPCERCGRPEGHAVMDAAVRLPWPTGYPLEFSTCTALVPYPEIIWDANGYYRSLGISPGATRREIMEAYVRLGGPGSPRLTHIVSQLLDRDVRMRYDATPIGHLFIDYEVETLMRQAVIDSVTDAIREGRGEATDEPMVVSVKTVLDPDSAGVQDDRKRSSAGVRSPWGHYRWQARYTGDYRMAEWRGLLAAVLYERGEIARIAVGTMGCVELPWSVEKDGDRLIVFLNESEQPTEALARQAASRVVAIRRGRSADQEKVNDFNGRQLP